MSLSKSARAKAKPTTTRARPRTFHGVQCAGVVNAYCQIGLRRPNALLQAAHHRSIASEAAEDVTAFLRKGADNGVATSPTLFARRIPPRCRGSERRLQLSNKYINLCKCM
ncbi:unnamed protein product, partial [Iphiclides podalirius]